MTIRFKLTEADIRKIIAEEMSYNTGFDIQENDITISLLKGEDVYEIGKDTTVEAEYTDTVHGHR